MIKLQAKRGFNDKKAKKYRATGEVFEVSESRAQEILATGVAKVIGKVEKAVEKPDDPPKKEDEPGKEDGKK